MAVETIKTEREKMNKKHLLLGILLMCSFVVPQAANARLGESNIQIAQRYGAVQSRKDISTNIWMGYYLFKEYNVGVIFYTNICVAELISPIENRSFGSDERDALMKSIGGEGTWIKADDSMEILVDYWVNTTTKARARVETKFMQSASLIVMSPIYIERENAEQKAKEKAKAKGF